MAESVVTGAAGFIGNHLADSLARAGESVTGLDIADPAGPLAEGRRHAVVDLRDGDVRPYLQAGSTVYHLASRHLEVGITEAEYAAVNVDAAVGLVEACADAGVRRLVHVSTVGIYGHVEDPPADEDAPRRPGNLYERTKLRGERAVMERAATLTLDTVVVRPAWVYGPGCPRTAKLLRAVRKRQFFFVASARNLRHPVHIDDMVRGLRSAASAPAPLPRRDYILAGPQVVTVRELVDACARVQGVGAPRITLPRPAFLALATAVELAFRVLPGQPPLSRRTLAFFENDNAFDIGAARRDLGFEPRIELDEGLEQALERLEPVPSSP